MGEKAGELMDEDIFDLVGLFYFDADPHTIDTWLYQDLLILVSCYREWVENKFG